MSDEKQSYPYGSGDAPGPSSAPAEQQPAPAYQRDSKAPAAPTLESPFTFPSEADLPAYTAASAAQETQLPVAIPQTRATASSPLVQAFPPSVLGHGIPEGTWLSFLETMSAFLTAKIGDRAVSHAGDMAQRFTAHSVGVGKHVLDHAKGVGKSMGPKLKRGNIIGVVGGVISVPVVGAFGVVRAVVGLPGSAVGAIVKKPRTPAQRAAAYAAVANKKWLHARGLHAQLLDTSELAQCLGVSASDLLRSSGGSPAAAQLAGLADRIAPLEVQPGNEALELSAGTLWLFVAPFVGDEE